MSIWIIVFGVIVFIAVFAALLFYAPNLENFLAQRRNKLQLFEAIALFISIVFLIAELNNSREQLKIANHEALTKNILHIEDSERFINEKLIEDKELLNALFRPDPKDLKELGREFVTKLNKEKMLAFILLHDWQKYYRLCRAGVMQTERWLSVLTLINRSLGPPGSKHFLREHWERMLEEGAEIGFHPGFIAFFSNFATKERLSDGIALASNDRWLKSDGACLTPKNLKRFRMDYPGYAETLGISFAPKG